ncbi:MAG TPA: hypothetical protein VGQ10_17360 [Vicinamibacterales bacterium]|nr:hypothetical protein [Vicinamibacterales bacterium]
MAQLPKAQILQDFADAEAQLQTQLDAAPDAAGQAALTQELEKLRTSRRAVELTACGGEFLPSSLSPSLGPIVPGGDDV